MSNDDKLKNEIVKFIRDLIGESRDETSSRYNLLTEEEIFDLEKYINIDMKQGTLDTHQALTFMLLWDDNNLFNTYRGVTNYLSETEKLILLTLATHARNHTHLNGDVFRDEVYALEKKRRPIRTGSPTTVYDGFNPN